MFVSQIENSGWSPSDVPESTLAGDFVLHTPWPYNNHASDAGPVLIDAASGMSYSKSQLASRAETLSRGLSHTMGWNADMSVPQQRVVGIYSPNNTDFLPLCWAIHRSGGICLLLHTNSSLAEIVSHLQRSKCCAIFTTSQLLAQCSEAAKSAGIPQESLFLFAKPEQHGTNGSATPTISVESMLLVGDNCEPQDLSNVAKFDKDRIAFLCATSGTSGVQKLATITHYNVVANSMQVGAFENSCGYLTPHTALGILPQSHSYALITAHTLIWRGDTIVLHSAFDMQAMLKSIEQYRIERLYLIPPITAALVSKPFLLKLNDLSSVKTMISGGAPFPRELNTGIKSLTPQWDILPGFGLTETAVVVSMTDPHDPFPGSAGILIPGVKARIVSEDGRDINDYDVAGEILFSSPSIMQGYLDEPAANSQVFEAQDWLRTGDVGMFRLSSQGKQHLFVVDRLKDMIKVKGLQVSPVEIEDCLQSFPGIDDSAVIGVPDARAGERAKAFVVCSAKAAALDRLTFTKDLEKHVEKSLPETHWLQGRVTFVDAIPRNQAGKTLKKVLRTW